MNYVSVRLTEIYNILWKAYGPQNWWPGESTFEVMVGAVLTQNTNWRGVEKAIANLKRHDLLSVDKLHTVDADELAGLIRPSGYFNLKASRLKNLIELVAEHHGGDLAAMGREETRKLRQQLLMVKGVGPETADIADGR